MVYQNPDALMHGCAGPQNELDNYDNVKMLDSDSKSWDFFGGSSRSLPLQKKLEVSELGEHMDYL